MRNKRLTTAGLKACGVLVVCKLFTTFKLLVTGDTETGRKTRTASNPQTVTNHAKKRNCIKI